MNPPRTGGPLPRAVASRAARSIPCARDRLSAPATHREDRRVPLGLAGPPTPSLVRSPGTAAIPSSHVVLDDGLEFAGDIGAAQGGGLLTVDEHGGHGSFAGARQRDADVGVL